MYAKLLIFADDIKIFIRVKSITECELLPEYLIRFVLWRETLNLKLNIAKCHVMTFTRLSLTFLTLIIKLSVTHAVIGL